MVFHCYDSLDASIRTSFSASWNLRDLNHCRHSTIHSSTFQILSPTSAKEHQKATLARHAIGEVAIENPGWSPFSSGSWPRAVKNQWNWWPLGSPVMTIFLDKAVWNANIGSKISQGYWWSTDWGSHATCHVDITGERYAMIRPHSFCTFTAHSRWWIQLQNGIPEAFLEFLINFSYICETSLGGLVRKKSLSIFFAPPFVRFTSLLHILFKLNLISQPPVSLIARGLEHWNMPSS